MKICFCVKAHLVFHGCLYNTIFSQIIFSVFLWVRTIKKCRNRIGRGGGGGALPFEKNRDFCWKIGIKPLEGTNLGVTKAFFGPRDETIFHAKSVYTANTIYFNWYYWFSSGPVLHLRMKQFQPIYLNFLFKILLVCKCSHL